MCEDLLNSVFILLGVWGIKGWTCRLIPAEITPRSGRTLKYRRCWDMFRGLLTCPWASYCTLKCSDCLLRATYQPWPTFFNDGTYMCSLCHHVRNKQCKKAINNIFLLYGGGGHDTLQLVSWSVFIPKPWQGEEEKTGPSKRKWCHQYAGSASVAPSSLKLCVTSHTHT